MDWVLKSMREAHFSRTGEAAAPVIALCFTRADGEEFYLWAPKGVSGFHIDYLPSELHPDLGVVPTLREY